MSEIRTIGDLHPDPRNTRKHGPRNAGMIGASLAEVGAARSIVIDEDGTVLAGNGVLAAAADAGIERVRVVDTDGQTLVAVRRSGLTSDEKRRLSVLDNRAGELAEWDLEALQREISDGLEVGDLWRPEELDVLLAEVTPPDVTFTEYDRESLEGADTEWTELKFRVPLGAVAAIEQQTDRICRLRGYDEKKKGLALARLADLAAAADDDDLRG